MAFWEDFGETISMKGKEMADKAKNLTDIASLKGQIVSYENTISKYYREIGHAYYEAHKKDVVKEFPEQMNAIAHTERAIKDLEKRISELRGTKKCTSCGSEVPENSVFCLKCGAKIEEDAYFDEEDAIVTDVAVIPVVDDMIDEDSMQ